MKYVLYGFNLKVYIIQISTLSSLCATNITNIVDYANRFPTISRISIWKKKSMQQSL